MSTTYYMSCIFKPIDVWPVPMQDGNGHKNAPFRTGYEKTIRDLEYEIHKLGAEEYVIETFHREREIRRDGMPRADSGEPHKSGVIVSFTSKHGNLRYPCCTFDRWRDNLRAIALGLEALRKVDRYGISTHGEQYAGYAALPAPGDLVARGVETMTQGAAAAFIAKQSGGVHSPTEVLESSNCFAAAYRACCHRLHPDRNGGDDADFKRLQQAKKALGY